MHNAIPSIAGHFFLVHGAGRQNNSMKLINTSPMPVAKWLFIKKLLTNADY